MPYHTFPIPRILKSPFQKPAEAITTLAQKLLNLPILIDSIAGHSPKGDLFVVQRVNSTFHRIIAKAKVFQEMIYRETLDTIWSSMA